jgi:hypothetical protein
MRRVLLGLAACAVLAVGSAAQAAGYLATYTGVVSDSYALQYDSSGENVVNTRAFGAVNGSFDGAAYTLKLRYDTAVGFEAKYNWTDNLSGSGANSPVSWAAIIINGHTVDLGPFSDSSVVAFNGVPIGFPDVRGFFHTVEYSDADGLNFRQAGASLYNITIDHELNQTFSGGPSGGDAQYAGGSLYLQSYNPATDTFRVAGAHLNVDHLTVEAIPEPAAWALMLTGLAGLGLTLRRRRAVAQGIAA